MARVLILGPGKVTSIKFTARYDEERNRWIDPIPKAQIMANQLRSGGHLVLGPVAPEWNYKCP